MRLPISYVRLGALLPFIWIQCLVAEDSPEFQGASADKKVQHFLDKTCGPACLYVALSARGVSLPDFESFVAGFEAPIPEGYSISQIIKRSQDFGVRAVGLEMKKEQLLMSPNVCVIAHMKSGHFVLLVDIGNKGLKIVDPPLWKTVSIEDFSSGWSGKVIVLDSEKVFRTYWLRFAMYISAIAMIGSALLYLLFVRSNGVRKSSRFVRNRGISLLEVVVCIAILGILFSLILVGVNSVRESSRNLQCAANIRQLGMALSNYASTNKFLPLGCVLPRGASAYVGLAPYLEVKESFASFSYLAITDSPSFPVPQSPIFSCPSDPVRVGTNYRVNVGDTCYSDSKHAPFLRASRGCFVLRNAIGLNEITDGLSSTAVFAERVQGSKKSHNSTKIFFADLVTYPPYFAPPSDIVVGMCSSEIERRSAYDYSGRDWAAAGLLTTWYNHVRPPNSRFDCVVDSDVGGLPAEGGIVAPSSYHRGGVNVCFADGHTSFIRESIELSVWMALGSRSGNEPFENGGY